MGPNLPGALVLTPAPHEFFERCGVLGLGESNHRTRRTPGAWLKAQAPWPRLTASHEARLFQAKGSQEGFDL